MPHRSVACRERRGNPLLTSWVTLFVQGHRRDHPRLRQQDQHNHKTRQLSHLAGSALNGVTWKPLVTLPDARAAMLHDIDGHIKRTQNGAEAWWSETCVLDLN